MGTGVGWGVGTEVRWSEGTGACWSKGSEVHRSDSLPHTHLKLVCSY